MSIKWNRVTWYSQAAAIVLFVMVFGFGFYVGRLYERWCLTLADVANINVPIHRGLPKTTASLTGHYVGASGTAELDIVETSPNRLHVTGLATWHGANDMANTGDIDGEVLLTDGRGIYEKDDCHISLQFADGQLTAEDNLKCGGMNVTFTDVYRRQ